MKNFVLNQIQRLYFGVARSIREPVSCKLTAQQPRQQARRAILFYFIFHAFSFHFNQPFPRGGYAPFNQSVQKENAEPPNTFPFTVYTAHS